MSLPKIFAVIILTMLPSLLMADGFSLKWSLKNEPHVVLSLTPDQVNQVGRERKLALTEAQKKILGKHAKNLPPALGVESLGEPDCSCCISCAMWTSTNKVTIWTKRLTEDGSKYYHECRQQPGHFTMDATGQIFAASKPVTWNEFVTAVKKQVRRDKPRHLSLPPEVPPQIRKQLDALPEDLNPSGRL